MDSEQGNTVIGIYIHVADKLGPEGSPICLVESTPGGTLILTSPDEACNLKIILNHLNMTELQWLIEALQRRQAA